MPTNAEKEPMPPPPLASSLKDLDLKPNDAKLQQAIFRIRIYQAQAIRLTREQQEEMCDIIKSYDYVRVRTAKTASAHKLYKQTMNALKKKGKRVENLSWPIYLILSAVYKKLPKRGSESASSTSANASNISQNPFASSSSAKPFAAPAGSMFAPAGSTLFSLSTNAPSTSTNSFPSAANAASSFTRLMIPTNASAQSKDVLLTKPKDAAQKAIEDQRMSGPALQHDEQDLTSEEDSDSSSSEVEVLWHKKRQASVNREDDPCFAAKRPRPSSSGKPFDIATVA
ncbi:hypothetical protein V8C40DRAFT_269054 [Trichoderma camerunense]